jgi:outer membrane protein OmpA-like peptidoglycan-associated protein
LPAHNLKYLFILQLFLSTFLFAQKKSYTGQGAVSEIIMSSQAEMVGHFDMFFKSKVSADETDKHIYWYKIVFNKACTFDFTLFPILETDHYGFELFKVENNINFCEAKAKQTITKVDNTEVKRTYHDNYQSEVFRSNLITSKKVDVKAGEAVYIVVKSIYGLDRGHFIGLNTCDYGYVLEVDKTEDKKDTTLHPETVKAELNEEEALASIGHKLCPKDSIPVKLGTLSFNKKIEVSNQLYTQGESKNSFQKQISPGIKGPRIDQEDKPQPPVPVLKVVVDTVAKKADSQATLKSILPKPDIWLKEYNARHPEPEQNNKKGVSANKMVPVKCLISDAVKGSAINNQPIIRDELTGQLLPIEKTNTGEYEFLVEKGRIYKVQCNVLGYKNFDHSINIYKILNGEENEMELKLQPLVAGENFILKNIYFHPNTPVIKDQSSVELENLYSFMKNNEKAIISIEGHTNSNRHISRDYKRERMGGNWAFHGTAKKLSKCRAEEVREYLKKKGIEPGRIKTKGWGGNHELYPNARTIEESAKNMRVEVLILKI